MGDEQYPFRINTSVARKEADKVFRGIAPMVRHQVETMNWLDLDPESIDEIYSNVMSLLWERSLPAFDTTRKVKLSTFLHSCSRRFIIGEFRRRRRQANSKQAIANVDPHDLFHHAADPEFLSRRIQKLASDIILHPSEYLNKTHARVLMARVDNPQMPIKDLATLLGYQHPRSLSSVLTRIKEIISELEIIPYATDTPE